jgi:capsid protein
MLSLIRDHLAIASLRARHQRMLQERLLDLTERSGTQPLSPESDGWHLLGGSKPLSDPDARSSLRDRTRRLVRENPYAANILRLLDAYVTGPGLQLSHQFRQEAENSFPPALLQQADQLWKTFERVNFRHYSFSEHARRCWRDGEAFLRLFRDQNGPPRIRFVDPELIMASATAPDSQGILTRPLDVETPLAFLLGRPGFPEQVEQVPAEEMLQTRIGSDSNEKRGVSLFAPLIDPLEHYERWMETELQARKLQSSIVLWRKVQGSPQAVEGVADSAAQSGRGGRRERFSPGTILTTNHATEIQFLQPDTNFGDAVPLGRMLLLSIAAGAGLPEFMLTADASNANFASTMIAEGPAVKFFHREQQFFGREFTRLWRRVMEDAQQRRELPENFFDLVEVHWTFPQLVNRDRPSERMADVRLLEAGVLSRAEVARRDGVRPEQMQAERAEEHPHSV